MEVPTLTNRSNLETHFKTLALQHMPATQREIPGRPTREGKEAPPLPAPLPAGNSGDNIVTRCDQAANQMSLTWSGRAHPGSSE